MKTIEEELIEDLIKDVTDLDEKTILLNDEKFSINQIIEHIKTHTDTGNYFIKLYESYKEK